MNASSLAMKAAQMAATKPKTVVQEVKPVKGPDIPAAINTREGTIVIYGHNNISKTDLELIAACFSETVWDGDEDVHGVRIIKFLTDGRPVREDGQMVLANCSIELGGISINLQRHFDRALEYCVNEPERSIWPTFNMLLLQSYLHEACHIACRQTPEKREMMDAGDLEEEEKNSEAWSFEMLVRLARKVCIEPDDYAKSPYFLKKWNEVRVMSKDSDDPWFKKQQFMLDNRIMFKLEPEKGVHEGLESVTFKEYVRLMDPDSDNEEWANNTTNSTVKLMNVTQPEVIPGADIPVYPSSQNCSIADEIDLEDFIAMGSSDVEGTYEFAEGTSEFVANNGFFGETETIEKGFEKSMFPVKGAPAQNGFGQQNMNRAVPAGTPTGNKVYPNIGLTPEQVGSIVQGVYMKIYNHMFTNCVMLADNDVAFERPEAVCMLPITLTEDEKKVIVKCDAMDSNGRMHYGVPTEDGNLWGYVSSKVKLPMYTLYINNCGSEDVRKLMPQNTNKRNNDGSLTKPAAMARSGVAIMYAIEGNDQKAEITGKKYIMKCTNGVMEAC